MDGLLELFGTARWRGGGQSVNLPDNLPGYLVAYLAFRGDWIGRESLSGLFWPDRSDAEALHNLRANLHRVRLLLGAWSAAEQLEAEPRRVRLRLATDVDAFRVAIGRGDWRVAAGMRAGPLLCNASAKGFPLFEEWARQEGAALRGVWQDAALKSALQDEIAGRSEPACELLLRVAAGDDASEAGIRALLRVASAAGRKEAALVACDRYMARLGERGEAPSGLLAALRELRDRGSTGGTGRPTAAAVPQAVVHPPRLVGRDAELRLLRDSRCAVTLIAGEPGVGKSRLLDEGLPRAWTLACREALAQVPLGPVAELIDDQRESLPISAERRRILGSLVPALLNGEQLPPVQTSEGRPRMFAAIAELFCARAQPIVFDDLQWADDSTLDLIAFLARRAVPRLVLAYRSNEVDARLAALLEDLEGVGQIELLRLAPLSAKGLTDLVAAVSRSVEGPAIFSSWLHQRTGGNPFFALQTLRSLFESGQLSARGDGWASALDDISADYSELRLPPRVEDLVRRRVLALSETTRRALAAIAVVGQARAVEQIAAVAGLSPWACAEAIDELQGAGVLDTDRFAHDLVRQSFYDALAPALRTVLHASVARNFAGLLREESIAEHWWLAGEEAHALTATLAAVRAQRTAGLHGEACSAIRRALARVAGSAAQARLLAAEARVRFEQGDLAGAEASARSTLDEAASPGDRAAALMVVAAVRMQQGKIGEASLALAEAEASDAAIEGLCLERAKIAQLEIRAADAIPALQVRCSDLRRQPPGSELIQVLSSLGAIHDAVGDAARGLALHEEAYRLATRLHARYAQVEVAVNLLWSLSALGRNAEACAIGAEALAIGEYDSTPTLRNNLVWCLREVGRIDEAITVCEALVAGPDPTLSLIARARIVDMTACRDGPAAVEAAIEALLAAIPATTAYASHATAVKVVLLYGSDDQAERVVAYLRPIEVDPWLQGELRAALLRRGLDPERYFGTLAEAH